MTNGLAASFHGIPGAMLKKKPPGFHGIPETVLPDPGAYGLPPLAAPKAQPSNGLRASLLPAPKPDRAPLLKAALDGFQRGFDPAGREARMQRTEADGMRRAQQTLALLQHQRSVPPEQRTAWWQQNAPQISRIIGQDVSGQPVDPAMFADDVLDGHIATFSAQLGIAPQARELPKRRLINGANGAIYWGDEQTGEVDEVVPAQPPQDRPVQWSTVTDESGRMIQVNPETGEKRDIGIRAKVSRPGDGEPPFKDYNTADGIFRVYRDGRTERLVDVGSGSRRGSDAPSGMSPSVIPPGFNMPDRLNEGGGPSGGYDPRMGATLQRTAIGRDGRYEASGGDPETVGGLPPPRFNTFELTTPGARGTLIAKEDARMSEMREARDNALKVKQLTDEFITVADDAPWQGETFLHDIGQAASALTDGKKTRLQQINNELAPAMRQAGSGAMSDKDVEMYKSSVVHFNNTGEGNAAYARRVNAVSNRLSEYYAFMQSYRAQFGPGTLQEAERYWTQYADAVPVFDDNGNPNPKAISSFEFFTGQSPRSNPYDRKVGGLNDDDDNVDDLLDKYLGGGR